MLLTFRLDFQIVLLEVLYCPPLNKEYNFLKFHTPYIVTDNIS